MSTDTDEKVDEYTFKLHEEQSRLIAVMRKDLTLES